MKKKRKRGTIGFFGESVLNFEFAFELLIFKLVQEYQLGEGLIRKKLLDQEIILKNITALD